eukprot:Nk52_evm25s232 gene=Nk52_evmTU25s232
MGERGSGVDGDQRYTRNGLQRRGGSRKGGDGEEGGGGGGGGRGGGWVFDWKEERRLGVRIIGGEALEEAGGGVGLGQLDKAQVKSVLERWFSGNYEEGGGKGVQARGRKKELVERLRVCVEYVQRVREGLGEVYEGEEEEEEGEGVWKRRRERRVEYLDGLLRSNGHGLLLGVVWEGDVGALEERMGCEGKGREGLRKAYRRVQICERVKQGDEKSKLYLRKLDDEQLRVYMDELGLEWKGERSVDISNVMRKVRKPGHGMNKGKEGKNTKKGACCELVSDYLLVLDFEATCEESRDAKFPNEIIEFPVCVVDCKERRIVKEFHSFVKPAKNPILSEYCRQLTSIRQEDVDAADAFPEVLDRFMTWLRDNGLTGGVAEEEKKGKGNRGERCEKEEVDDIEKDELGSGHKSVVVATDGVWDLRDFLEISLRLHGLTRPEIFRRFIDLRGIVNRQYNVRGTLNALVEGLGMEFEGTPHRGVDDTRNIARIAIRLLKDNITMRPRRVELTSPSHFENAFFKQKAKFIRGIKPLQITKGKDF